jgi:hypothetical protein
MTSPLERARLLDAEMQLQRAWLELNLREMQAPTNSSPWEKLQSLNRTFNFGSIGLSILKHRSLWLAAVSMLINMYRRHKKN